MQISDRFLPLTAELLEHHYTLYYYDPSGSLVKTIPPEGVQLLSSAELEQVKYHRNLGAQGCYQFSDSIKMSGNSSIAWNNVRGMKGNQFSVEMMLNLSSVSNQVLVSRITELNIQPPAAALYFRYSGSIARVVNGSLLINIYGIKTDSGQLLGSYRSVRPLNDLLLVSKWNHLVIQRTGNSYSPLQALINGNLVALQSESNNLSAEEMYISNAASPLIVGSYNASQLSFDGTFTGTE